MELKICKTFNDTMEQHVEAVKAIKEEMVGSSTAARKTGEYFGGIGVQCSRVEGTSGG